MLILPAFTKPATMRAFLLSFQEAFMEYEQLDFDVEEVEANDPLTLLLRQEAADAGYDDVEAYLAS